MQGVQHDVIQTSSPDLPIHRRILPTLNQRLRGGVNVLMMGGAVKNVANNINLQTWRALGTRNRKEVVTLD